MPHTHRTRVPTLVAAAVIGVVLGVLGWSVAITHNTALQNARLIAQVKVLAVQGAKAHHAVCALDRDLVQRIDATHGFLATHPGATILGVPRKTVETSAANQAATVAALGDLQCVPPVPAPAPYRPTATPAAPAG